MVVAASVVAGGMVVAGAEVAGVVVAGEVVAATLDEVDVLAGADLLQPTNIAVATAQERRVRVMISP